MKNPISLCASLIALLVCFSYAQSDPYTDLSSLESGKDGAARAAIEKQIREGGPAAYAQVEAKLLAALARPNATPACRKFVCDTLRIIGSEACIKPIIALLGDEKEADLARLALESLPGNAADEALIHAVQTSAGRTRIGLIQTLGARRSGGLVALSKDWLNSGDAELARATVLALGRVGGANAIAVLKSAQVPPPLAALREGALVDAAYSLAHAGGKAEASAIFEEQFRSGQSLPAVIASLNGLVDTRGDNNATPLLLAALKDSRPLVAFAAARASARPKDAKLTQGLVGALPSLPPAIQVAVLRALSARGDKIASPAVKASLKSPEDAVKTEAALALEKLGDATVVNDLAALAIGTGPAAAAAQQTLSRLNAPGVNEALVAMLDSSDAATVRVAAVTLRARGDFSAIPRFLQMASSDKDSTRAAAIEALDGLAGTEEMPALMALLRKASANDQEKVASLLWKSTRSLGSDDERFVKLWATASAEAEALKVVILKLASVAGGPSALETIKFASGSEALKDAAARTLCQWPNESAVTPLADLIQKTANPTHRILATRAVVRLLTDRKCSWLASKKIETLEQILPKMERDEEKKMINGAMAKFRAPAK